MKFNKASTRVSVAFSSTIILPLVVSLLETVTMEDEWTCIPSTVQSESVTFDFPCASNEETVQLDIQIGHEVETSKLSMLQSKAVRFERELP